MTRFKGLHVPVILGRVRKLLARGHQGLKGLILCMRRQWVVGLGILYPSILDL